MTSPIERPPSMAECLATGGHHWTTGARGVLFPGPIAETEERCASCPASRMGQRITWQADAPTRWTEPYNRETGPYPWRELTSAELVEAAAALSDYGRD